MTDTIPPPFSEEPQAPPGAKEPRPRRPPADKPIDGPLTQTELEKQISQAFNAIPRVFNLPDVPLEQLGPPEGVLHFEHEEFRDTSEALIVLFAQHSQLRIIIRVIGPLAAITTVLDQIRRIAAAFKLKRERDEAIKQGKVIEHEPSEGAANGATDGTTTTTPRAGIFGRRH